MNDESDQDTLRLKQMLEEVTAADASVSVDAETASLREAWLAFGQLAAAADASLPAMPDLMISIAPRKARRSHWLGLIAATAAALLVAVTLGWWIRGGSRQQNGNGNGGEPAVAHAAAPKQAKPQTMEQGQPKPAVAQGKKAMANKSKTGAAATSVWDDSLETQISSVSRQVGNLEQNWQHRVDDLDLVQYRIDEMSDSLQNDVL